MALNAHVAAFNEGKAEADRISPFGEAATETEASAQLNKLAFWMATGSGKTLLMHAHVLQYRRLLVRHGRARDLNRILLLTPNEGLSRQHLRELETAGIEAEIFDKQGRAVGGSSPDGRSRSWRSPSSGTRWGTGPSPWRRSRGTTSC